MHRGRKLDRQGKAVCYRRRRGEFEYVFYGVTVVGGENIGRNHLIIDYSC